LVDERARLVAPAGALQGETREYVEEAPERRLQVPLPRRRERVPAPTYVDARELEPPEHVRRVRAAARHERRGLQLVAVERRERRIRVAGIELEQREMPADVSVHPAADAPVSRERVQHSRAVRRAVPDREGMRERMDRKRRAPFDFEGEPRELLGAS